MNINVKVQGIDKVMRGFDQRAKEAVVRADKVTETYTRKMANESAGMAPVDSGDLQNSILASPRRISNALWQYGSELPYARRQEYEHKSKKGFIRKSVWDNREAYREAVKREVTKE